MKYLKSHRIYESSISKPYLVDRIKWYSSYLHQYMKDVNTYTTSNLNFSFSYDTGLTISQIFDAAEKLEHNSSDGFITAICNEFIRWSEYIINDSGRIRSEIGEFRIDKGYNNYTNEYKQEHRHELYKQPSYWLVYAAVGRDIKNSIDGTIWDIPTKSKFTHQDIEFIIDIIISDFEVDKDYITKISNVSTFSYTSTKRGITFKIPSMGVSRGITYESDFINRLQFYFSGALILDRGIYGDIKIYLPFYQ